MKPVLYLILLLSLKVLAVQPVTNPIDRTNQEEAIAGAAETWRKRFQQVDRTEPSPKVIEELAEVARAMGHFSDWADRLNVQPAFGLLKEVQAELVSIPGHAEHYRRKMEEGMARFEATPEGKRSLLMGAFGSKQSEIFRALEVMPSPETVKVLGDYLSDERGWDSEKGHEVPTDGEGNIDGEGLMNMQRKNCDMAVRSLARLIENPPESENIYPPVALPAWRLWYNQVKAGNRTYRFKGNPVEYDLNGPVEESKIPDAKRSDRRGITGSSAETKKEGEGSNNPTIIAMVLAVLIAGGYWVYQKKAMA